MTPYLLPKTPSPDSRKGAMERYASATGETRKAETPPERSGDLLPEATFSFSKNKKIYLNSRCTMCNEKFIFAGDKKPTGPPYLPSEGMSVQ